MKFTGVSRAALVAGLFASPFTGVAFAQTPPTDETNTVFVLGRIENGITDSDGEPVNASSIGAEEMRKYDRASVDEAIDLIPGANASNTGGSRNERLLFVRGFDRFQTTLSIDGVRVFLPADNRIDFGRFMTADIAEVQVSKGYVSVLNGPGGIGGAVNLVTRKPTGALDVEATAGVTTDKDFGTNSGFASAFVGTRADMFYAQASGAWQDRQSWTMSDEFVAPQPSLETGGERVNSGSSDYRLNLKAGFTPNDTDEYAISYLKQSGEKNAPYHVSDLASTRFWTWPYWDLDSVYFLSRTQLGPNMQLRSRVYYNTFQNLLSSFDSAAQTTQSLPRAFNSYYDDTAYGGNVTLEVKPFDGNTLTAAAHYRKDQHSEKQLGFTRTPATGNPSVNAPYEEPWQPTEEDTYSIAVEDVHQLTGNIDLVAGASYEWTNLIEATDANVLVTGTTIANSVISFQPVAYPLKDMDAINYQGALIWHVDDNSKLHASVSSRTRFPTLFERFSSRFGTAIPNPDIEAERATNWEVGGEWSGRDWTFKSALFYSKLSDALIQASINAGAPFGVVNQTKNIGEADYYGVELETSFLLAPGVNAGGNLTLINRNFPDPNNPAFQPQGVPESKAFFFVNWEVIPGVTVTPSFEVAGQRWTVTSSSAITPPRYYQTGTYGLVNIAVDWNITNNVSVLFTGKNLTDRNYVLVDGFPEEGTNFALSLRYRN